MEGFVSTTVSPRPPKIVIVGAGSRIFAARTVADLYLSSDLQGAELVLVDISEEALERTWAFVQRLQEHMPDQLQLSRTTDQREALAGADFVVTSIAVNRMDLWRQDYLEPLRLGFHHCYGENGGPGAVFHTLRNLTPMVTIARDMEELCPDAWILNFTNPENRVCLALNRHSSIKTVGLCGGVDLSTLGRFSEFLGIPRERMTAKVGGVNHFNWMLEFWDKETGEDLFPRLRARVDEIGPPKGFEMCCELWDRFGVFPTTGDSHVGEYLSYGHEYFTKGFDYDHFLDQHRTVETRLGPYVDGSKPIADWVRPPSDADALSFGRTLAIEVIEHLHWRKKGRLLSVIVPNQGAIDNLAEDSLVETAGLFEDGSLRGEPVGALPTAIASMVRREQDIQELVVAAWAENSRSLALQALLLDPNVDSVRRAEALLDRMLKLQVEYLPPLE